MREIFSRLVVTQVRKVYDVATLGQRNVSSVSETGEDLRDDGSLLLGQVDRLSSLGSLLASTCELCAPCLGVFPNGVVGLGAGDATLVASIPLPGAVFRARLAFVEALLFREHRDFRL